jgi:hypothetical protein
MLHEFLIALYYLKSVNLKGWFISRCILFLYSMCLNVGGEEKTIAFLKREGGTDSGQPLLDHASEKGIIHHHFPVNFILKPWRMGTRFYQIIKFGIFQYVFH